MAQDLPNSNFISYLSQYGLDSNLQFDEHVSKEAQKLAIEPFEFAFPKQKEYREEIQKVIAERQSKIILLSGRAGDGKTHFLRQLFTDPEILGFSLAEWEKAPNCFSLEKDDPRGPIHFTFVKDFTNNDDAERTGELKDTLIEIMEQNAQGVANSSDLCHIVLIAGNNGKVMERFHSFFGSKVSKVAGASAGGAGDGSDDSSDDEARLLSESSKSLIKRFCHALESYMLNQDDSQLKEISGVLCLDMSACLGPEEIKLIFTEVMNSKHWEACESCAHYEQCPICRNRKALTETLVLNRLLQLHELVVDNGHNFTVRNVLLLLVNALLGSNEKLPLSCSRIDKKLRRDSSPRSFSSPFDNIFALNGSANCYSSEKSSRAKGRRKKAEEAEEYASPIFRDLEEFAVGDFSTKQIDQLLLAACTSDEDAPEELRQVLQQYDCYGLSNQLREAYDQLQKEQFEADDPQKEKEELLSTFQASMSSLRRLLFFVVKDKDSAESHLAETEKFPALFAPYILTSYHFALSYLGIKHFAMSSKEKFRVHQVKFVSGSPNTVERKMAEMAASLIIGLNRVFSGLLLANEASEDQLYITTTNKFNPDSHSILFNRQRYVIGVKYKGYDTDTHVYFALNHKGLLELRCCFDQDEFDSDEQADTREIKLLLTPRLFEYLVSLASGKLGFCFPFAQDCYNEISAFKAAIEYQLNKLSTACDVKICEINDDGALAE